MSRNIKTVVVLGAPRSGTSVVAEVVSQLGIKMADDDRGTTRYNKPGYREDREFEDLSRKINIKLGLNLNWDQIPTLEELKNIAPLFEKEIKELIHKKEDKLWGWKDPLTGTVIPIIHPFLKNPHYILTKRDINSIVRSMKEKFDDKKNFIKKLKTLYEFKVCWDLRFIIRRGIDFLTGRNSYSNINQKKKVIEEYYSFLESFLKDKKFIEINYEELIENPEKKVEEIISFLNIRPSKEKKENAIRIINPNEKHF